MINLIHSTPSETEIAAILASTSGRPSLPVLGDPAWSAARDKPSVASWLAHLTSRGESEAAEPLPVLTGELYADFFKTGDRLPFENPYFERRRRLARAAVAILLGDDATRARLLPSFLHKLGEVMDETSWSLPAHVGTEPTGKNPWMIDLFAAETANNLADLLVVFTAVIPPNLAQRIKSRLHVQIFENYVAPRAGFAWLNITNNWNAVCHQGVLGAALAIEEDHALVARMLSLAAGRLPAFLGGYGDDGSTSEGPSYWSYGFGWFAELNAQLEHRTQGQLSVFEGDAKVASIARFAPLMTLSNGHMVNFSDGGRTGRLSPSLLTYLGERFSDPTLSAQGAALYRHIAHAGANLDKLRCDFFNLSRLVLRTPPAPVVEAAHEVPMPDAFLPDYGAIVARGTDARGHLWEFAAKAGHNDEHHNHNDCGSFLLNIDGAPAIIEIGAPEYVRAFFSDKRYEFLAARSLGHSVPFVNGCEQSSGREFAATVLRSEVGTDLVEFTVDLTKCYPPEARCLKLIRTWIFKKSAGVLTIIDAYELDGPGMIESLLICPPVVTHEGDKALITTPKTTLRITPIAGTSLATLDTCDYRGHHGTDEQVQRLRFAPSPPRVAAGSFGYKMTIV